MGIRMINRREFFKTVGIFLAGFVAFRLQGFGRKKNAQDRQKLKEARYYSTGDKLAG